MNSLFQQRSLWIYISADIASAYTKKHLTDAVDERANSTGADEGDANQCGDQTRC